MHQLAILRQIKCKVRLREWRTRVSYTKRCWQLCTRWLQSVRRTEHCEGEAQLHSCTVKGKASAAASTDSGSTLTGCCCCCLALHGIAAAACRRDDSLSCIFILNQFLSLTFSRILLSSNKTSQGSVSIAVCKNHYNHLYEAA